MELNDEGHSEHDEIAIPDTMEVVMLDLAFVYVGFSIFQRRARMSDSEGGLVVIEEFRIIC